MRLAFEWSHISFCNILLKHPHEAVEELFGMWYNASKEIEGGCDATATPKRCILCFLI